MTTEKRTASNEAICVNLNNAETSNRRHGRARRWLIIVAAILICVFFVIPSIAVRTQIGYRLLYMVAPAAAQFYKPVQMSCEQDGIRMEVVSAHAQGDTAEIVLTMQDLTGNRMDASVDLYDSYDFVVPFFDSTGTCNQISYDAKTKTATFRAAISTMDGTMIPRGKATFSVTCLLSGKQIAEDIPLTVNWSKIDSDPETIPLRKPEGGYTFTDPVTGEVTTTPVYYIVLKPGEPIATLQDGFDVTGLGYIDGRLHLQLYTPGRKKYDDHAFLYLIDGNEKTVHGDMVYHMFMDIDGQPTNVSSSYIDYVFDVPQESLAASTLYGSFYAAKIRTEGDWRVTFPLDMGNSEVS